VSKYTQEHADALADLAEAGAAIVFTRTVPGTIDDTLEQSGLPTTAQLSGKAMEVDGSIKRYEDLKLVASQTRTVLFAPDVLGQLPLLDDETTWGGIKYRFKQSYNQVAPDGEPILAYLIIAR
jgi:hypothetical protein